MEKTAVYQVNPKVRTRKTHDGRVLVTILGARIEDVQHVVLENASAVIFWDVVREQTCIEEVRKGLMSFYSNNYVPEIAQDLEDFIKTLLSTGILIPENHGENHGRYS